MKIGVLGSGDVGRTLGGGFASLGHQVMLGTREPNAEKVKAWVAQAGSGARVGTFSDAASFAELAVVATRWSGTENALELAGPRNLTGKVVIDATNPLDGKMPPGLAVGHQDSGGEQVQRWLPQSRVVKAFNIVGHAHMVKPSFPGGPPDMLICGNDSQAKRVVGDLIVALGWPPAIDLGGIEIARYLEPFAMVWVAYGFATNGWNHAFKLLRK